jgi:hypothetical protein
MTVPKKATPNETQMANSHNPPFLYALRSSREIAAEAAVEPDNDKLLELVQELNAALEREELERHPRRNR